MVTISCIENHHWFSSLIICFKFLIILVFLGFTGWQFFLIFFVLESLVITLVFLSTLIMLMTTNLKLNIIIHLKDEQVLL